MDDTYKRKYDRVLDILRDVSDCAGKRLALAGGTALALFYLKHRVSVDLDFIPIAGEESEHKEALKGCLSKKGYRTQRGAYTNQFMVQFEDATIKVEIFKPSFKIGKTSLFPIGSSQLRVVSLKDLMLMKAEAYSERLEARDLFDIMAGDGEEAARTLLAKYGEPKNLPDVGKMANSQQDAERFRRMVSNASAAGN